MPSARKDPHLGEKLEHLEGILGYCLPAHFFRSSFQAEWVGTTPQQFSRKRNGKEAVSNRELSKLIALFRLGEPLDYRIFQLDPDAFIAALAEEKIGTNGHNLPDQQRQILLDAADRKRPVALCRINARRAGGIGAPSNNSELIPEFRVGDLIYMQIPIPEDGHLLVLNDNPTARELACLMPSCYAPETVAIGNSIRIPTSIDQEYFGVSGPPGFFRIFAIWSDKPLPLDCCTPDAGISDPSDITDKDLSTLSDYVKHAGKAIRVMTGEYMVA